MQASCYAVRRVNPFLGVTQVVELGIGRALSSDGRNWEIQLAADQSAGWGSLSRGRTERHFRRYAVWSADEGLATFPGPPVPDPAALRRNALALIGAVEQHRGQVPFALADRFELWLLDAGGETPVALMATATGRQPATARAPVAWRAAPPGEEGFRAPSSPSGATRREALDHVENLVARRAGSARAAHWFERAADRRPAEADFPELPLSEHWERPEDVSTVSGYLAWLAPRLLTLPLSPQTRERLEWAATADAALVERLCRLYPAVADAALINRTRVQARLAAAVG